MMATLSEKTQARLRTELNFIFESDHATIEKIEREIGAMAASARTVSNRDTWLITYGDSLKQHGQKGLHLLARFYEKYLGEIISDMHILPFFPWSSDDGFSVMDYYRIDPKLGDWDDVKDLRDKCGLMFDAVLNHMSSESEWFKRFLNGDPRFSRYFIEVKDDWDLERVFRPRTLPLVSEFESPSGIRKLWTTFSRDQIDLNAGDPDVFLEFSRILLFYSSMGARVIRLDAIGFLWKEPGTSCMHHPKTHAIIRFWRALLDELAPGTLVITETNVPHAQNISYLGLGGDEAHMVYQFPLPPLALHALHTGSACEIRKWLATVESSPPGTTYFNFLASHDGIGVLPASGWLDESQLSAMIEKVIRHGGHISYRKNPDGSESPYEMNITYFEAVSDPSEPEDLRIAKFIAAHCLLLSVRGVPAIYIHSLLGSLNDESGYRQSGIKRRINRERLDFASLCDELDDAAHRRGKVFRGLSALLHARSNLKALDPYSAMKVLECDHRVIALERILPDGAERVLCLVNVSSDRISLAELLSGLRGEGAESWPAGNEYFDAISGQSGIHHIESYQGLWLSIR
ncbi:MAG: sucrose phosphorylase [Spirochaetes bacterium]|nr:MAG: sucrose phosphorylase [Spirochaetota bacterium]